MASVLFSAIGQAAGGPLGAAVGAAVGGGVDAVLFGGRRRGSSEMLVQGSAYGDVLARLYGRTRVSGQLIWALPLAGAGGKGSGRRSAGSSFAIALSSGPIRDVRRIWADGREIRNMAGEFEAPTVMRLHDGGLAQAPDPLIVAAEGEGQALAYCGLAYVLFEEFDLAPFGNRIPNFSFEVLADEGGPGDWLREQAGLAGIAVPSAGGEHQADGYAVQGRGSEACGLLSRIGGFSLSFDDAQVQFVQVPRTFEIARGELLAAALADEEVALGNRPAAMALTYLDVDRDYLPGRQRVARVRRGEDLESEIPLSASAGMALSLVARLLRDAEAAAERIRFGLSWRWLAVAVGDVVAIEGLGQWRIIERDVRGLLVLCSAERVADQESRPAVVSDPGRALPAPMVPPGMTDVQIFETPVPLAGDRPSAWLWMGGGGGWRGATASQLVAGEPVRLGEVRVGLPRGRLLAALPPGPETMWDLRNRLLVAMEDGAPSFESRSEADVLAGANLLRVGEELLQFRDAEPMGGGFIRLSGLLRGRFGTGFRMRVVEPGAIVRLLAVDQIVRVDLPSGTIGRQLVVLACGRGDPVGGTEAGLVVEGLATGPMAPVHVRAMREEGGSISCEWQARSAADWAWGSGDPSHSTWIWWFCAADGRRVSKVVEGLRATLSVAEQVQLLGSPFERGAVTVEAMGDGPVELRTSATVWI